MSRLSLALFPVAGLIVLVTACETLPAKIDESATVDQYLAQGRYRAACVGLESRDEEIVTYTAQRLVDYGHMKDARECLCAGLYDPKRHKVNLPAGIGVDGSGRDDLAECMKPAIDDSQLTNEARTNAVRILGGIGSSKSYDLLVDLMKNDGDEAVRALAAGSLRQAKSATGDLVTAMQSDKAASVRASAATSLDGHKGDEVEEALTKAALEDAEGTVRAAALAVLAKGKRNSRIDDMLCTAMMQDESADVRTAAVKAYHGTKRKDAIDCLGKRLLTEEESPEVRQAAMDALKASPNDAVNDYLCKAIGPIVKRHIENRVPTADADTSGTHIVKAQNDRDWEKSYQCVSAALGQGGYSCAGKWYLTNWYNALGGERPLPTCEGMSQG